MAAAGGIKRQLATSTSCAVLVRTAGAWYCAPSPCRGMPRCHVQYMCLSAERPPVQPNLALVVLPAPAELVDQESSDSTPTPQPSPRPVGPLTARVSVDAGAQSVLWPWAGVAAACLWPVAASPQQGWRPDARSAPGLGSKPASHSAREEQRRRAHRLKVLRQIESAPDSTQ